MSWIAFLLGFVFVVLGAGLAILSKSSDGSDTEIDVFGIKVRSRRAGYIIMVVGVVLILLGARLPNHLFPGKEVKDFKQIGNMATFGCESEGTSEVIYNAPAGYKIINATPSTENLSYVKSGEPAITRKDDHQVAAKVVFAGKDKEPRKFGNCPGGGSGQVVVSGQIEEE